MRQLKRSAAMRAACLLACSLFVLTLVASARADAIYTYTGNPFTSCSGPCSGALSGSLTLAQALAANSTTSVQFPAVPGYGNVVTWSFTDGNFVWTPSNSPGVLATFTTGSSGQIVQWTLNGGTATVGSNTFQWQSSNVGCAIHMLTCVDSSTVNGTIFAKSTLPGSWTRTTTVPEPSSVLLLALGLVALATMYHGKVLANR
jgi:hypothetical protein